MRTVTIARGQDSRQIYEVTEPMTVREWVTLNIGDEFPTPMICLYQGQPLLRAQWEITIIETNVVFAPLPLGGGGGGGGKNPLAMIGMVVVMLVAAWAGPALAGYFGLTTAAGALTGMGTFVAGLTSAAIMMAGALLVNALFPTKMPKIDANMRDLESASPTYSLTASQNQARLYQMIPEVFGTMDVVPDLGAQPWVEFSGNEQYLHQLLCVGIGEYKIHRISIEDTAIWEDGEPTGNFPEVEVEIVNPGQRMTLFPDNIETAPEVSGQSLALEMIGPFTANSAGTKTTAIAIDVIFPQGLGRMNQQAGGAPIISHTVSIRFDYRPMDDHGSIIGDWQTLIATSYTNATRTPQRHTHIINIQEGRYQVRGVCTGGGQQDPYLMNEVVWGGMKAYLPSKLVYPDITMIGIRARATNALSQSSMRQFHVTLTRKLPKWNPASGWSGLTPTNSWAWAMAAMSKAPWGGRRTDRQIDLDALYRLDQELTARGDEFCQVLDTRQTVFNQISEACRCVRAIPRTILSTISWMRDSPGRPVRGVFTPHNIVRGSFSVDYAFFSDDSPDDVIIEYRDRDGWVERDVRAALPDSLSLEPARKRFIGVTSRAQAYREACFEAACNAYRRIFLSWSTELEGRLLSRGDLVLVTHPLGGEGHWASVTGWDQGMAALHLDTALPWEENSEGYYVVLRRPNGMPYGPVAVARVDEKIMTLDSQSLVTLESVESTKDNYIPVWEWLSEGSRSVATAVTYGKESQGLQAIILSVKPRQNGVCDIEAVVEDDRVHQADLGPVPPWTPGGEASVITTRPVIANLVTDFDYEASLITISWTQAAGAVKYQVQFRSYATWEELVPNEAGGSDWVMRNGWSEWNDLGESFETLRAFVVPHDLVEYRVRGIGTEVAGLWVTQQVDCSFPMPAQVAISFAAPYDSGNLSLQWPAIDAQQITLVLSSGKSERMRKSVAGDATAADIIMTEMQEFGGPWRDIEVYAISLNGTWETRSLTLTAIDAPPAKLSGVSVALSGPATALLTWNVATTGCTGYVVIHVDPLGVSKTFTINGDGTTQISIPVAAGTNKFSVAGKDALYDINTDLYALYFSDPVSLEVTA